MLKKARDRPEYGREGHARAHRGIQFSLLENVQAAPVRVHSRTHERDPGLSKRHPVGQRADQFLEALPLEQAAREGVGKLQLAADIDLLRDLLKAL